MDQMELPEHGVSLPHLLAAIEQNLIKQALERKGGVKAQACKLLGINRTTLVEKLKRYGMAQETQEGESC